ncbi:IS200/IS605 family transposase [Microbulbifer variabilis]|uniref:IS200/IS605 family transposase n=1 Tax=Microbulbifer variabilis TaxID=266805 RepID=UPI001CFECA58
MRRDWSIFRDLCRQKGSELVDEYTMRDRIHILSMIPPKFSISNTIGFLKGKFAIQIFRRYEHVQKNYIGRHFGARDYGMSTVGLNEQMI